MHTWQRRCWSEQKLIWKPAPQSMLRLKFQCLQAHLEQAGVDELAGHADATPQQVDTLPASAKPAPAAAAAPAPSTNGDSAAPPAAAENPLKKEKKRKLKEKTEGAAAASADVRGQSSAAFGCGLWVQLSLLCSPGTKPVPLHCLMGSMLGCA